MEDYRHFAVRKPMHVAQVMFVRQCHAVSASSNNNNNNNNQDSVYGAVIMAEPLPEFTWFI